MDEIEQLKTEMKTMEILIGRLEKRIIALETPKKKVAQKKGSAKLGKE